MKDLALINLLQLERSGLMSISKIQWWLLKYSDFYKNIIDFVESKREPFELEDGTKGLLPPLKDPLSNSEKKFLGLYEALNTITELHRNENYFQEQMKEYHKIKYSKVELKKWVFNNEDLGAKKYVCFLIDYLDYSENSEHLKVYVPYSKELDLYIDRKDFRNTVEFLEIFNELYWEKEILPKSLVRFRTEMEKTRIIDNKREK